MFGADAATGLKQMVADAEKAVALDPQDCESLGTLAFARMYQGRWAEAEAAIPLVRRDVPGELACPGPGGVRIGIHWQGGGGRRLGDRALRLDPRMTPANLSGVKDAYYMARRYEDTIDAVMRMPEEQRARDAWVILAASYARLGRTEETADTRTKVLKAFRNVSAERVINEDYAYARKEDEEFFVDGFRVAGLPVCMTAEEIGQFPALKPLPECEAERAKAVAAKS